MSSSHLALPCHQQAPPQTHVMSCDRNPAWKFCLFAYAVPTSPNYILPRPADISHPPFDPKKPRLPSSVGERELSSADTKKSLDIINTEQKKAPGYKVPTGYVPYILLTTMYLSDTRLRILGSPLQDRAVKRVGRYTCQIKGYSRKSLALFFFLRCIFEPGSGIIQEYGVGTSKRHSIPLGINGRNRNCLSVWSLGEKEKKRFHYSANKYIVIMGRVEVK